MSPQQIDAQPSVLRRKRWTRDDVRAVAATGAFNNSRYELVNGELIDKLGMNPPHSTSLVAISGQLIEFFGWRFVRTQIPIDVAAEDNANSEPEPDV